MDLKYNYCALLLSIFLKYTPEQAFEAMELGKPLQRVDPNLVIEMRYLRQQKGFSYGKIGKLYGVSADVAFRRINGRKKKSA
jgi:hypothetical protein